MCTNTLVFIQCLNKIRRLNPGRGKHSSNQAACPALQLRTVQTYGGRELQTHAALWHSLKSTASVARFYHHLRVGTRSLPCHFCFVLLLETESRWKGSWGGSCSPRWSGRWAREGESAPGSDCFRWVKVRKRELPAQVRP